MKIGLYSVTYRGVWYRGEPLDVFRLVRLAKQQGWEGLELDAERPHAAPMDLSADDRKRLRDLAGESGVELCAVSPNCDLSSPVPVQREAMICYVRECIKLAHDIGSPICKIFAALCAKISETPSRPAFSVGGGEGNSHEDEDQWYGGTSPRFGFS
jgi:sugar phosphate isomerase/epimerase